MSRLLLAALVAGALALPSSALAQSPAPAAPTYTPLAVTGKATVDVRPDRVEVSYTIERKGKTKSLARSAVARRAALLLSKLGALGVDPLGVRFSDVVLYKDPATSGKKTRYVGSGIVVARTAKVELAGQLVDLGTALGADVRGPAYSLVDDNAARDDAMRVAVEHARRRAEIVAGGLGMRIVRVRSVSLDGAYVNTGTSAPVPTSQSGSPVSSPSPGSPQPAQPTTPTPVAPGALQVSASVSVTYDLE